MKRHTHLESKVVRSVRVTAGYHVAMSENTKMPRLLSLRCTHALSPSVSRIHQLVYLRLLIKASCSQPIHASGKILLISTSVHSTPSPRFQPGPLNIHISRCGLSDKAVISLCERGCRIYLQHVCMLYISAVLDMEMWHSSRYHVDLDRRRLLLAG